MEHCVSLAMRTQFLSLGQSKLICRLETTQAVTSTLGYSWLLGMPPAKQRHAARITQISPCGQERDQEMPAGIVRKHPYECKKNGGPCKESKEGKEATLPALEEALRTLESLDAFAGSHLQAFSLRQCPTCRATAEPKSTKNYHCQPCGPRPASRSDVTRVTGQYESRNSSPSTS